MHESVKSSAYYTRIFIPDSFHFTKCYHRNEYCHVIYLNPFHRPSYVQVSKKIVSYFVNIYSQALKKDSYEMDSDRKISANFILSKTTVQKQFAKV